MIHIISILGASSVLLGAFAAHALSSLLLPSEMSVFKTAVQYHQWGALLCLLLWMLYRSQMNQQSFFYWATQLAVVATILFSGSLYLFVWLNWQWLVFVTPVGGILFPLAWLVLWWGAK